MNRLDKTLKELRRRKEKALITFITAGDPDLETTERLVLKMIEGGADVIELGVPFSDPVAEGPIIQRASKRALESGSNLELIFNSVERIRVKTETPLALMMYINSIYCYGKEAFFKKCLEIGVDAVIVPDLPFEERDELMNEAKAYKIHVINLIAPTSNERIGKIAVNSEGFLYCITSLGVTGTRETFQTDFRSFMDQVREHTYTPAMLGFGISNAKQVKELKEYADGVIVGSSIVKIVEAYGQKSEERVGEFVRELKSALR